MADEEYLSTVDGSLAHLAAIEALSDGPWVFDGHIGVTREEIAHAIVLHLAVKGMLTPGSLFCGAPHSEGGPA